MRKIVLLFSALVIILGGVISWWYFSAKSYLRPIFMATGREVFIMELEKNNLPAVLLEEAPGWFSASISGRVVFFSKEKNPGEQVAALQIILERTRIEGKGEIDLRFPKPILR